MAFVIRLRFVHRFGADHAFSAIEDVLCCGLCTAVDFPTICVVTPSTWPGGGHLPNTVTPCNPTVRIRLCKETKIY